MTNYARAALGTADHVGLTFISSNSRLIGSILLIMNQNARDKLIHYSLWKSKDFPSHLTLITIEITTENNTKKQATVLVHCSACDAHEQITGNSYYLLSIT